MVSPKTALRYIDERQAGKIDMMIQFETQCADCLFSDWMPMPFSLRKLKSAFSRWQTKLEGKGWNMLYLENHDHPRIISRYGSEQFHAESGKALAVSYLFLKGTPFIYQGQEIGMTNWRPADPDMYEDVQTRWQYAHCAVNKPPRKRLERLWRSSRDSARTPMQWSAEENAGFTTGKPWFYVNQNYTEINVQAQEQDPDSLLNFYRKAVLLRKSLSCVRFGSYRQYFKRSRRLYVYSRQDDRQKILVVCSFSKKKTRFKVPNDFDLVTGKLVLQNYPDVEETVLKPYETRVYLWR